MPQLRRPTRGSVQKRAPRAAPRGRARPAQGRARAAQGRRRTSAPVAKPTPKPRPATPAKPRSRPRRNKPMATKPRGSYSGGGGAGQMQSPPGGGMQRTHVVRGPGSRSPGGRRAGLGAGLRGRRRTPRGANRRRR